MKKTVIALAAISFLFTACQNNAEAPMSEAEIQTKVDSTVDAQYQGLEDRANEDLDRRMVIEVKPKADSIVAAKKGK